MNYGQLLNSTVKLHERAQGGAAVAANQFLVIRNWLVGAYNLEFEQEGHDRAEYGARLLERRAEALTERGLRGLNLRTLRDCRQVSRVYSQIRQTLSAELEFATAGMDIRLFVSRYLVALPKPEQLHAPIETDRARFEHAGSPAKPNRPAKAHRAVTRTDENNG